MDSFRRAAWASLASCVGAPEMMARPVAWLVWFICGSALAFSVSAVFLVELNGGEIGSSDTPGSAILAVSFSAVGAVIVSRRPGNQIGLILLTGGFFNSLNAFSAEYPT